MKQRIAKREFSLPKHGELMHEINDFSIAVKIHHTINPDLEDTENVKRIRENISKPSWTDVTDFLNKIYLELQDDRYNPRKY